MFQDQKHEKKKVRYLYKRSLKTDQQAATYSTPYKFNGKEFDAYTRLYYYGVRYYDPKISLWYGVDPLAEKYLGWSPNVYCMDNPENLVDPDGRDPIIIITNTIDGYATQKIYKTETYGNNGLWNITPFKFHYIKSMLLMMRMLILKCVLSLQEMLGY